MRTSHKITSLSLLFPLCLNLLPAFFFEAVLAADKPNVKSGASAFTDIEDVNGEKEIKDLVTLGVLKTDGGKFEPSKPITRAMFASWLVKANNILRPDKKIVVADAGSKSTFSDVPASQAQFKFIQGLANAGWSVGYDDKTFKPDKALTREEMIAIKTPIDVGRDLSKEDRPAIKGWSDYEKIGKRYTGAMSMEASWEPNWVRCFGKTKSCEPQKPVSRAEAAICVWQFDSSDSKRNISNYTK